MIFLNYRALAGNRWLFGEFWKPHSEPRFPKPLTCNHLVFGEGDGKLLTPEVLNRRMKYWRNKLGAIALHWRRMRTRIKYGFFFAEDGQKQPLEKINDNLEWDDFEIVPKLAHENGMKANLYVSLFDEGWPLAPKEEREDSYHNKMHYQHVSWQSRFSHDHPEYVVVDKT